MLDERSPDPTTVGTTAWMLAFLAVAILLVAIGLGGMVFGPSLS